MKKKRQRVCALVVNILHTYIYTIYASQLVPNNWIIQTARQSIQLYTSRLSIDQPRACFNFLFLP